MNQFRQEGDFWSIAYQGRTIRLPDSKGLHYLVALLRSPNQPIDAWELALRLAPPRAAADDPFGLAERTRKAVRNRIHESLSRISALDPSLGCHLKGSIRTGGCCAYTPTEPVHFAF